VENYIPTVIATLIEPVWVMLNRLLCVLQPFEELRRGNAAASNFIELDYSSLPPQLVIFKALRKKHVALAVVCVMALLANVLAVGFGAMFNEMQTLVAVPQNFTQPCQALFRDIDPTVGPWNVSAAVGGGWDQFYIAMSNLTAMTTMPP
jgi:hypothetical protein